MATYYWMTRNRGNKYNNRKVEVDGRKFDSKKEARRYGELKLLLDAGEISDLHMQVAFELQPKFYDEEEHRYQRAIKYVADFVYLDKEGNKVIEDVKSPATRQNAVYRLKKKMMAYRGWYIKEV